MRFIPTLTLCAALFSFALINTAEAQTDSPRETESNLKLDQGEVSSRIQTPASSRRQTTRVAMRTISEQKPARDSSTSPRKLAPAINRAAFEVPVNLTTAPPAANATSFNNEQGSADFVPQPVAVSQNVFAEPQVAGRVYIDSPQIIANQARVASNPAQYLPNASAQPMPRRNFFGIDEDQCCDEWDGFTNCGGLKANPGHYGLKWLHGKDACEPEKCRHCQTHKNKKECKKNCRQNCSCCE